MRRFEITDTGRHGVMSGNPAEPRSIPGYVWYPAEGAKGTRPYLEAAEIADQLPSMARNFGYASGDLDGLRTALAHSRPDAVAAHTPGGFPIVIFSPGLPSYPAQNTALIEQWASHGYIVIALSHPHDVVDIRLSDGSLAETIPVTGGGDFGAYKKILTNGMSHEERTGALAGFAETLPKSRLGASFAAWRDDTLFIVRAIQGHGFTKAVNDIMAKGDDTRLALTGMSFGGNIAAATCGLVTICKAAINLDGLNYDPNLFDADVGRPLLLLQSDWPQYPASKGQSQDPAFSPNDYAYEHWARSGLNPDVIRIRVDGIRHMGFTDLLLLADGANRIAMVGNAEALPTAKAIAAISLSFLDRYLKQAPRRDFDVMADGTPLLHRRQPAQLRDWAIARKTP